MDINNGVKNNMKVNYGILVFYFMFDYIGIYFAGSNLPISLNHIIMLTKVICPGLLLK